MSIIPSNDDDFSDWLDSLEDDGYLSQIELPSEIQPVVEEQKKTLIPKIQENFEIFQARFRIPELSNITNLIDKGNFPDVVQAIRSMVGDDEVITTNSLVYALLSVLIGSVVAKIKTSWEDVQFHPHIYNYAEGFVFLPPSMDSSFESVNKYAKNNGVPFLLDPVKFKNLSAVRKQSDMERDLPSKFRALAEAAAWTHPSWLTWNLHQFALILGIETFDFIRSKVFPYMFSYEGGCGGAPPWNNLYTAAGAIYRYRRGKAKKGILGIMTESNQLVQGNLAPEDCFFTKNLNLAISGDERWTEIRSYLEQVKSENKNLGLEYYPEVVQVADDIIPPELVQKSTTLHPRDALTGIAVSYLREKNYLVTELDLVTIVNERSRLDAIWGKVPLAEIADQIELRKQEYQDAFLETITDLSKMKMDPAVKLRIDSIGEPFAATSLAEMQQYYRTRIDQGSIFNSFIYNERIRVFKRADVENYFAKGISGIRNQFCKSIDSYWRPEFRRSITLPDDKEKYDAIEEWLDSADLDQLFAGCIPPGIGPDDSRLTRTLGIYLGDNYEHDAFIILIISSDRKMINACQQVLAHNYPHKRIRVCGLNVVDYARFCLVEAKYRPRRAVEAVPLWLRVNIFNIVAREMVPIHGPLQSLLLREAKFLWQAKCPKMIVEYDYPNINRTFKRFQVDRNTNTLREFSGGYLSKGYVATHRKLAISELDSIVNSDEFDYTKVRSQYPADAVGEKPIRLYTARQQVEKFGMKWIK